MMIINGNSVFLYQPGSCLAILENGLKTELSLPANNVYMTILIHRQKSHHLNLLFYNEEIVKNPEIC